MPCELVQRAGNKEGEMYAQHVPPGVSLLALDACYDTWQLPTCSSLSGSFASLLPRATAVGKRQENPQSDLSKAFVEVCEDLTATRRKKA